jgi:hypothetical protein
MRITHYAATLPMPYSRLLKFITFVVLLGLSCTLLAEPPRPVIPTPPATAQPFLPEGVGPLVTDPVSAVVPAIDPDIDALMSAVSRQNLVAYVQQLESFVTRNTLSDTQRDDYGIGAARRWLRDEFEQVGGGRLQVRFDDFPLNYAGLVTNQRNVIATLPGAGRHPGVIVVTAHYDSRTYDPNDGVGRAPGANDNGSGVAAVLELARLMSSRTWNQTIIFAAFTAEEQGTHGSRHFIQRVMLDGMLIDAAINNDIVGGRPGIPQYLRSFTRPFPEDSNARQLIRYIDMVGGLYMPTFPILFQNAIDRPDRYSDHMEFLNVGVPAVRITESVEDFSTQHTGFDTSDRLDYDYLRQVVQANLALVGNMAGAPGMPSPPTVAPMANAGDYILTWRVDPQAAGYIIAFRPLGSDEFEPFRYVTNLQAGNVALTGFDPQTTYAISLAALSNSGRISLFSPEILAAPQP